MIAGLVKPDAGEILFDGKTLRETRIGYVFQNYRDALFPWLTARENVAIGVDRVYPAASQAERQEVVEYYLERVGLADAMHRPASETSAGMRRQLQYVLDYARSFGVPTAVLRMSCIYGPRQMGTEDQGWVAHFLIRALEGKPITLYGDGRQVRDILDNVEYVASAIRSSIAYAESAERALSILDHRPDLGEDYVNLADEVLVAHVADHERDFGRERPIEAGRQVVEDPHLVAQRE